MQRLPRVPRHPVGPDGAFVPGAYEGAADSTSLTGAAERLRLPRAARLLREKRWVWFSAADRQVAVGGAVVDLGYAGNAFLWVIDREARRLVADGAATVPPFFVEVNDRPAEGLTARATTHRGRLAIDWRHGSIEVHAAAMGAEVELELAASARPLTAICLVAGEEGAVNVTQKLPGLPVAGTVRAGGRTWTIAGGLGALDRTHGLLARRTAWRWIAAAGHAVDGTPVGVNLVDGFNDGLENAVWIEGVPFAVGRARFAHDRDHPDAPWRVATLDGEVDLVLQPEAVRKDDLDVGLAASRYVQPFGVFSGRLAGREVRGLAGVAEDHEARW